MNTKARSEELKTLAAEIAARENLTALPDDSRRYIREIAERGVCHIETARTVWRRCFMASQNSWGGPGRKQGRKPGKVSFGSLNVGELFFVSFGTQHQKIFEKIRFDGQANALDTHLKGRAFFDDDRLVIKK